MIEVTVRQKIFCVVDMTLVIIQWNIYSFNFNTVLNQIRTGYNKVKPETLNVLNINIIVHFFQANK